MATAPTSPPRRGLDPQVVSRLGRLDLKARLVVEGFISGLHKSPFHGFSVEFVEHRQYMPGDPLRSVDWKVYAKSDRFYVKQYEDETNLRAHLVVDHSASMAWASRPGAVTKLEYARSLAAALAYLMLQQQDAVGLLTFAEKIETFVPARARRSHLDILLRELERMKPGGKTALAESLHHLAERVRRRGLVILFSDLMASPEAVLSGLAHFRHRQHEVLVFHILETGEEVALEPWELRGSYKEKMGAWLERYRAECRRTQVEYVLLDTATPYDEALFAYLEKRRRLH
jgi:uncharacterized protein (DUF58 family)